VRLLEGEAELLADAAAFRRVRTGLQETQLRRMAEDLPLPQVHLPFLFTSELGRAELDTLADAMVERIRALPDEAAS
jgi:hypothetical protein